MDGVIHGHVSEGMRKPKRSSARAGYAIHLSVDDAGEVNPLVPLIDS
jgi:hypothetical protein